MRVLIILVVLTLSACGHKGSLYLPDKDKSKLMVQSKELTKGVENVR